MTVGKRLARKAAGPIFEHERVTVYQGDCLRVMAAMPEASVDTVITDPPYALTADKANWRAKSGDDFNKRSDLAAPRSNKNKKRGGFMGKEWDSTLPPIEVWQECLRVAKPGAILLAFGGTRTFHRLACAI